MLVAPSIITLVPTQQHPLLLSSRIHNATYKFLFFIGILLSTLLLFYNLKTEKNIFSSGRLLTECSHKVIFRFHANNNSSLSAYYYYIITFLSRSMGGRCSIHTQKDQNAIEEMAG
jgi:hypothetical protein